MDLIGEELTLHHEDFDCAAGSRTRIVQLIKFKLEQSGTRYITRIVLPHHYFEHITATNLYKDLSHDIHPDVVLVDSEYGF